MMIHGCSMVIVGLVVVVMGCQEAEPIEENVSWSAAELDRVGQFGGADSFGSVDAVVPVGQTPLRLAVLDAMNHRVVLLDERGEELSRYGRRGEGPGELQIPMTLRSNGAGDLLLLERSNRRLLTLGVAGDALYLLREVPMPFDAADMCVVSGRPFVVGVADGMLLHELNAEGGIVNSFGPVGDADPLRQALLSEGELACHDRGRVALGSTMLGEVRVFTPDGTPVGTVEVPAFARTEYPVGADGSFRPRMPEVGYTNTIRAVRWLTADELLVQLARSPAGVSPDHLWRVGGEGEWTAIEPAWPTVLAALENGVLVHEDDPFPVIRRYTVR